MNDLGPEASGEPTYRQHASKLWFHPYELAVAVVLPGTAALIFRGQKSDTDHLAEWNRRDIEVAKTLLRDALNQLDAAGHPQQSSAPAVLPQQLRYPNPW